MNAHLSFRLLAGTAYRWLLSARVRSEWKTRRTYQHAQFQGSTYTRPDRYRALFSYCQAYFQHRAGLRILSFGCSTGEEVDTLADYLPQAVVTGVDINAWCLQQCKSRSRSKSKNSHRLNFLHRSAAAFQRSEGFDAVFCLAVFQRTEHRTERLLPQQTGFTFDCFEQEITMLAEKLRPGGLLFLEHADFRFEDTGIASGYDAMEVPGRPVRVKEPVFGRDGRPLNPDARPHCCFRKR